MSAVHIQDIQSYLACSFFDSQERIDMQCAQGRYRSQVSNSERVAGLAEAFEFRATGQEAAKNAPDSRPTCADVDR